MWKSTKWKVVAGAATLTGLGIGGFALADSADSTLPTAINLQDRVGITDTLPALPDFVVTPNNIDFTDFDSPFSHDYSAGSSISVDQAPTDTGRQDSFVTQQGSTDLETVSAEESVNSSTSAPGAVMTVGPGTPVDLDTASDEQPLIHSNGVPEPTAPGAEPLFPEGSVDSGPSAADASADS
jgi:hypothetical protein